MAHGPIWTIDGEEIRRRRTKLNMTVQELADRAGLERKTVERIEKGQRVRVEQDTALGIASALGCKKPTEIGKSDDDKAWEPWTGPPEVSPAKSMMATGAYEKQAERESRLGIAEPYLVSGEKQISIMSFTLKKQCDVRYRDKEGTTIAVCGKIRKFDEMPDHVAAFLKADSGSGAGYYIISREIAGLGPQGGSDYIKTVVYVPSSKHGRTLVALHGEPSEVTVLARVVVRPARGAWPGFPTFDSEAQYRPYALVSTWVTRRGDMPEHNITPRRK